MIAEAVDADVPGWEEGSREAGIVTAYRTDLDGIARRVKELEEKVANRKKEFEVDKRPPSGRKPGRVSCCFLESSGKPGEGAGHPPSNHHPFDAWDRQRKGQRSRMTHR